MSEGRVLITGAGGFVGGALAEGFEALGWRVTALDLAFVDNGPTGGASVDRVIADLSAGVPAHLPPVDVVVHAAAVTTEAADLGWTRAAHVSANLRPLLAMLDYASRTPPRAFVFLSSTGVFASGDGSDALADTDEARGTSPYAAGKRAGETLVPAALEGVTAAHVVRLGYIYGPHEQARPSRRRLSPVGQWLAAARAGRPLEVRADDPRRDWTFAPDLAPAVARLVAGAASPRPVHVGSPFVLTDSAMAALITHHVPGVASIVVPASGPMKPPMRPSDIPALRGFPWTAPDAGIVRLAAAEVVA